MYSIPKMEIIPLNEEDVIFTSLLNMGNGSLDDIPVFTWPEKK